MGMGVDIDMGMGVDIDMGMGMGVDMGVDIGSVTVDSLDVLISCS
jgi:hypothetical protein